MTGHEFAAILRRALRNTLRESYGSELADELLALFAESDFPVRPAPATVSDTEPRWTLVRDPFGQYLAARYIARYSREWEVVDTVRRRVVKAVRATGFIEGAVHVVRLLEDRAPAAAGQLVAGLEDELHQTNDPGVRKSLEQVLTEL
ncbi:hypothetical protein [Streptomyces sp. NPDC005548]|uniref:hypothetical protein n=1 Tax=Streptomyces sp. NPDC005548 TaxID=3364724 RepID=UPI0036D1522D